MDELKRDVVSRQSLVCEIQIHTTMDTLAKKKKEKIPQLDLCVCSTRRCENGEREEKPRGRTWNSLIRTIYFLFG